MTAWRPGWATIPAALHEFWTERHLCTLTTLRPDGSPHVVPVGAVLDPERECAWVITFDHSRKVANLRANPILSICQVDGGRWATIEGRGEILADADSVRRAEDQYALRYRQPQPNPARVAVRVSIDRIVHGPALTA